MIFRKKTGVIALTILFLSCTSTADDQDVYESPEGKWFTKIQTETGAWISHGTMTFSDNKKATYTLRNGRIIWNKISDQGQWEGHWVEDNQVWVNCPEEKDGTKSWGEAIFQFNSTYTKFEGTWDKCGDENRNAWVGDRLE